MNGKKCSKCKRYLPYSWFASQPRSYDGLKTICRECINEYSKIRYDNLHPNHSNRSNNRTESINKLIRQGEMRSLQYEETRRSERLKINSLV